MPEIDPSSPLSVALREAHLTELRRDGYTVINNFASEQELILLKEFSDFVEGVIGGRVCSDSLKIVNDTSDYVELRDTNQSTVQLRGESRAWDIGMIDVFNPHIAAMERFPELENLFRRLKTDSLVSLMRSVNPRIEPRNTNLYLHRGVTTPRMPHVDSIRDYFKGFLAISDHSAVGSGPLGVIPQSHQAKLKNYFMCFYNRRVLKKIGGDTTNATFYSKDRLTPLILKPGDLALCNVSMVHGAIPAREAGYRATLVQCFDI